MKKKNNISKAKSYEETGEYWDSHDLGEVWDRTEPVSFDVDIQSEHRYFPVDAEISKKIIKMAKKRGVSSETLLNLLLQERVEQLGLDKDGWS